jgi:hypothetical protein
MRRKINCSKKDWDVGISAFKYTLPLYGSTMLVKKIIYNIQIYYYYLIQTQNNIQKVSVTLPLYKKGLEFTYYYSLNPIIE